MATKRLGAHIVHGGMIAIALITVPDYARAQSADAFFKSTSLTMYVGSGAGGGYDAVGRLVARHMSRFMPGNPSIVAKNMDTASGVTAANYVYNIAPKDGSAFSAASNSALALALYDSPVAKYDPRKFEWIGSTDKQTAVCITWNTVPVKSLDDATKQEVTVSATGVSAGPGVYPKILNTLFGTKFKVISGYTTSTMRQRARNPWVFRVPRHRERRVGLLPESSRALLRRRARRRQECRLGCGRGPFRRAVRVDIGRRRIPQPRLLPSSGQPSPDPASRLCR